MGARKQAAISLIFRLWFLNSASYIIVNADNSEDKLIFIKLILILYQSYLPKIYPNCMNLKNIWDSLYTSGRFKNILLMTELIFL